MGEGRLTHGPASSGPWPFRAAEVTLTHDSGRILRSIPFGRLGRPEEIAQVALFLCSPLAGWVTGQNIAVDGGQML